MFICVLFVSTCKDTALIFGDIYLYIVDVIQLVVSVWLFCTHVASVNF